MNNSGNKLHFVWQALAVFFHGIMQHVRHALKLDFLIDLGILYG